MAHSLGMETITEYVKDADILGAVKGVGIDYAQGYEIGPPGPARQVLEDWFAAKPVSPAAARPGPGRVQPGVGQR